MLLFSVLAFSQQKDEEKDKYLPKGNKAFEEKNYREAEADYRISQSKQPTKAAAAYNLGNSIYRQKKPAEAKIAYLKAIENAQTKKEKHLAFHNLGNAFMEEKNYQAAVDAYKNALRNNPQDDQTRYNFALAKDMLDKNPPPPKKDPPPPPKEDKKENKSQAPKPKDDKGNDKEKEKGDDQKDKGGKDQKDKPDDKGQDKPDKGNQGKDPGQASPSKQRMENLLDAMNNEEKKVQDRINAKKGKAQPQRQEKDW